jgi:hypothetical protein
MTDNERFEQWWEEEGKSLVKAQPDYRGTASTAFLEGLAIWRREGLTQAADICDNEWKRLEEKYRPKPIGYSEGEMDAIDRVETAIRKEIEKLKREGIK